MSIYLIGWVFYQAIIKKRKWADLKGDVFAVLFFVAVWIGVAYFYALAGWVTALDMTTPVKPKEE